MKNPVFFLLMLTIFIGGCEDKKKSAEAEQQSETSEITEDETAPESSPANNFNEETNDSEEELTVRFPQLTNENAVEFLKEYGKENPETRVEIQTAQGNIEIELFRDTPLHRANFIYLIKQGYFDETFFHRVVPEFIIQAGNSDLLSTQKKRSVIGKDYLLPAEIIPGRFHQYGTVSGAKQYRENPDNRTAPFEFFIFLGPTTSAAHLNGSYTIFGRVTKGMDVVEKLSEMETDKDEWPLANIYITALLK